MIFPSCPKRNVAAWVPDLIASSAESNIFSSNDPELINIELPVEKTTVEPKLIVNKPIEDMHPFISKDELSSLMIIKPLEN